MPDTIEGEIKDLALAMLWRRFMPLAPADSRLEYSMDSRIAALFVASSLVSSIPAAAQSLEEKAEVCTACHGENGMPQQPDVPIIWGQHEGYIYIQLRDYKSGLRTSDQMQPIVADLSREDLKDLAAYYSKKPWPRTEYRSSEEDEKTGQRIATAGICVECHLGGFVGTSVTPRVSGQTVTYLEKTLMAFKSRERTNSPDKSVLLASFSEEELKAMARYLAGIHVQQ
jgi:cytochrome c553